MKLLLCAVAFLVTSALGAAPAFPLKVSADGRTLTDAVGAPFFYHADTAWALPRNATLAEADEYFAQRANDGFTAIHLHAVTKEVGPVKNVNGDEPFAPLDDILKPNEAYWRHVDAVLEAAEKRGLLAAVSALWIRWGGRDKEGWRNELTDANASAYGEFLGKRYAARKNILWILGGDDNPHEDRNAIALMARALKAAAPHQLITVHNQPEHSSAAYFANEPWLDVNAAYTYREVAPHVLAEWDRPFVGGKTKPIFLIESGYEHESNDQRGGAPHRMRRQAYSAILSGALMGHAYGHREVWRFSPKWREGVADAGSRQMRHVRDLFAARAWWKLRPDTLNELVPSRVDRVSPGDEKWPAAARADDCSFALVYLPASRPVVVDTTKVPADVKPRWFDPTDGSMQPAMSKPWRDTPWQEFTPPAKNAGGDEDFVLVFERSTRAADFSVREHGATGDGATLDTAALQRAIEACGKAGGGRVVFPPGKYLSGTLHMRSGVELHLEKEARLIGTTDLAAYAGFSPESKKLDLPTSRRDRALIIGEQVKGIAFTGEGVIDGNKVFDPQGEEKMRGPHTILLGFCEGVTLRGLTIHESANYAFLIFGCDKVRVEDATFEGGWDGVHFRGWPEKWNRDLRITGCRFYTGDDSIAGNYVEDAVIERCVINSSCNGVRLIGPARRLAFTHCEFFGPGKFPHRTSARTNMLAALCLQPSAWGKEEGPMEDVSARDCTMRDVACAFHIVTKPGNTAQRLTFERIKATGIYRAAASVESWGERTFRDVIFRDVSLEYIGGGTAEDATKPVRPPGFDARPLPAWGFYHRNTEDILLERVTLILRAPDARPALRSDDASAPRLIEFSAPK